MRSNMTLPLTLFCIMAVLFCSSCQLDPRTAQDTSQADDWQALKAVKEGNYPEAENLFQSAIGKAKSSDNLLQLPKFLQEEGDLFVKEGKYSEAQTCYQHSLQRYLFIEKEGHSKVGEALVLQAGKVRSLEKLADVLVSEGKMSEAEECYKQAVQWNRESGGAIEDGLRISKSYSSLLKAMHKDSQAERMDVEADAVDLTAKDTERSISEIIQGISKGGDPAVFAPRLKSLALAAERFQRSDLILQSLHYLAVTELGCDHFDQASSAFRRAIRSLNSNNDGALYHSHNKNMAGEFTGLACSLELQGKHSEANNAINKAINNDYETTCSVLSQIIFELNTWKKYEYAQQLCKRLCGLAERRQSDRTAVDKIVLDTVIPLANYYKAIGQYSPAEAMYKDALVVLERTKANSRLHATHLKNLADCYQAQEKYSEADPLYRRALPIFRKLGGEKDPQVASIVKALAKKASRGSAPNLIPHK